MNKVWLRVVLLAVGISLLILGGVLLSPTRAEAALGNSGIPARCLATVGTTISVTLNCFTPTGAVSFVSGQSVPNGYYFLVTDVVVTPVIGGGGTGLTDFNLKNSYPSGITSINRFRNLDGATFGQHYNSPMWVLEATHFLVVEPLSGTLAFDIRVNGFLVTNFNYMPVVVSP